MKTRALGFLLMVAAAGVYAVGCGSSSSGGGTGGAGTGGKGGAAGAGAGGNAAGGNGAGGNGAGGKTDAGTDTNTGAGGKVDAGTDTNTGAGGKVDANTDVPSNNDVAPGDVPADTQAAPTFSDVYAIIGNVTTPAADTSPGCKNCHDGVIADGGAQTLPHVLNFSTKAAAFTALVGVDSLRCPAGDAGAAIKRVLAGNAAQSVLWQKLNQGLNPTQLACAPQAMPRQTFTANDGGADAGADAGFTQTSHYAITTDQLKTVMDWINAGALNN